MITATHTCLPQLKAQSTPPSGPPPEQPEKRSWISDIVEGARDLKESVGLLVAGSLFLHQKNQSLKQEQQKPPLADVPNVVLSRPLVLAPGWHTEIHKFDYLTHKLMASGQNGDGVVYLKEGKSYRDAECSLPLEQIPSNSKVFVNVWDTITSPPDVTAPQLKQNLALLHQAMGPEKVDLVGYSMGGLASRKYLDDGGSDIHHFMMLGTPNNGTRFGQMSARVIERDVHWALKFSGLSEADRAPMTWLAAGAPKLEQLNQRWPQQLAQVDKAEVVGSRVLQTAATGWIPFKLGDSMVEAGRLTLPGMESHILEGEGLLNHITLPHDSRVYAEMQRFFDFQPVAGDCSPLVKPTVDNDGTPYGQL